MADEHKKPESKDSPAKPEGTVKKTDAHKPAEGKDTKAPVKPEGTVKKTEATKQAEGKDAKPKREVHREKKEAGGKSEKATGTEKKAAEAAKRADKKTTASAKTSKKDELKIVDKPVPEEKKHVARAKANLSAEQKKALQQRRVISDRRPWFRRTQWYEYKRLGTAWRKPMGMDSAMRRHFGYEQSVVRVGFGGPKSVRGLHPSGFREVYVDQIEQLKAIDTKTQAARISGTLGARKLKLIYAEADKLGVRILNRRNLQ